MSKNEELDVTDFLTEGSVWQRKKGKRKGQEVKLLHLTNLPLIETAAAEEHPVRVVYANEKGDVHDRTVDDFCEVYRFHHVDGKLEARLNALLAFDEPEDDEEEEDEEEDDGDSDGSDAIDAAFGGATLPTASAQEVTAKRGTFADTLLDDLSRNEPAHSNLDLKFVLSDIDGYAKPALTSADLEQALVSYVQEPAWSHGLLAHRLVFCLNDKVTIASLREVFEPSGAIDTVASFSGVVAGEEIEVPWTTWIGVFPEVFHGAHYAAVHVGTEYVANIAGAEDETPEEDDATDATPASSATTEASPTPAEPVAVQQPEAVSAAPEPVVVPNAPAPTVAQSPVPVPAQAEVAPAAPAAPSVTQ
jgi:hypothetical protein